MDKSAAKALFLKKAAGYEEDVKGHMQALRIVEANIARVRASAWAEAAFLLDSK